MPGNRDSIWAGELFMTGLRGRLNGSNGRGFHYGDVIFYDVGYVRPVSRETAAVLEFNGRIADKDRTEDGGRDPNSGGHIGYVSVSVRHGLKGGFGLIATYQIPVWRQLDGSQNEKALCSISMSKLF